MDPITFSIIRHRLFRVVEEAVITLLYGARGEEHDDAVVLPEFLRQRLW